MDGYDDYHLNTQAKSGATGRTVNTILLFAAVTTLLTVGGLVMLYSASYNEALSFEVAPAYFVRRQLIFALVALLPMALALLLPKQLIGRLSGLLLLGVVALLALTLFSSFGQQKFGSRRWLAIAGLPAIQPSEFAKIALALFLAAYGERPPSSKHPLTHVLVPSLAVLLTTVLILAGRDYSSALLVLLQGLIMLVGLGLSMGYLIVLLLFITPPALVALFGQGYRIRRLVSFLLPSLDPKGINYQVSVSLKAIRRGGLFGVGLGNGIYKEGLLPEVHSDFIFASIAEEIGFIGVVLIIALFIIYIHLGFTAARRLWDSDRFFSLLAFGLTTMVGLQALLNLAVVTALLPPTGVPLPFFSQGGTNLLVMLTSSAFIARALVRAQRGGQR